VVKSIIFGTLFLIALPVSAFENNSDEGMEFFNKLLENVREYHLEQTMTKPEDSLDKALDDFWSNNKW